MAHRTNSLREETEVPARDTIKKSTENKKALIKFLCNIDHRIPILRLVGETKEIKHEEAVVTIMSYFIRFKNTKKHIQILADDTSIFVLVLYFF